MHLLYVKIQSGFLHAEFMQLINLLEIEITSSCFPLEHIEIPLNPIIFDCPFIFL